MSNNSAEQNGRQPPVPPQAAPPTDPRIRNVSSDQLTKVCRDFVWGICTKGSQCKFRHELEPESMKKIIKFCHDFQNRTGCSRVDCSYLHATREEENLFLAHDKIPRALAERHAAMASAPANLVPAESVPQMMYMPEPYMSHPPPRLPMPVIVPGVAAPPPPPPPPPLPVSALPPPPPPPPPPTAATTPIRMTAPLFTGPPPLNHGPVYTATQPPPPLLAMFDASRPPPPLPMHTTKNKNIAVKRTSAVDSCEAGPSKSRKLEGPKVIDGPCETCVQRELRIEVYRQKMQKMHCEEEYQSLIYKKKLEEYETGRALLKAAIGPDLFRILDEDIEGTSQSGQVQDVMAQYNQTQAFKPVATTLPNQFLLQLMECLINKRNVVDSTPATTSLLDVDEATLVQSLLALRRRQSPAPSRPSSDVISTILEAMRNSSTAERAPSAPAAAPAPLPAAPAPAAPPAARFVNGQAQRGEAAVAPAPPQPRYPPAPAPAPPQPQPRYPPAPAPAAYPPYQPAVPPPPHPPARPYYHHAPPAHHAHHAYHAPPPNNTGVTTAVAGPSGVYPARAAAPPAPPAPPAPAAAPATPPAPASHSAQYAYNSTPWRHPAQSRYYPPTQ